MSQKEVMRVLRKDDLDRSGLGKPTTVRKLRYGEMLSKAQTYDATAVEDAVSYEIPYFDPAGNPLNYTRWKLFPITETNQPKYIQEEKTIPRLYLPPLIDWKKVCADPSIRIIITEGEKKAACATNMGLPCIALGGVWSFTAKKWHMKVIPDWDWFELKDREIEICYDGDMYTNDNVAKALDALTMMLTKRGARVFIRYLQMTEGLSKLDDFLVARGVNAYQKLECYEADNSAQMTNLNDDLVYIKDTQTYYSTYDRILYGDIGRLKRNYGHIKILSESGKQIAAIDEWTQWPHMRKVDRMTYAPGEAQFINGELNDWPGWGAEPKRGNCKEFLDVIKTIDNWDWLLQWLAYPIQNPGVKMFSSVLIWSIEQGTGKTFIGDVMRDIYGLNSNVITSVELHDDSFVWMRNKQFILGEEVMQMRSKAESGMLKHIITGDTITINEKYVPTFKLPNCANLMFTSNKPDAIILDQNDRRFFVGKLDRERPMKFWNHLDAWRKKEGGPSAFMYYLVNSVDCSQFNPRAAAPETTEKKQMQDAAMTSLQQWVSDLLLDPIVAIATVVGDVGLAKEALKRDVFSIEQMLHWIPEDLKRGNIRVTLSGALTTLGAVRNSSPVKMHDGRQVKLFAIKNIEYWKERVGRNREWAANYEKKLTPIGKATRRRKT